MAPGAGKVSVLFSEPKIPQSHRTLSVSEVPARFSALQRAENSSIGDASIQLDDPVSFSALQRAENSSMVVDMSERNNGQMFQCSSASRKFLNWTCRGRTSTKTFGFSALQRAENSSIRCDLIRWRRAIKFQCSSASRKFLNCAPYSRNIRQHNDVSVLFSEPKIPQSVHLNAAQSLRKSFSALQRAENSSIPTLAPASIHISDRDDHASSFLSLPGASP